MKLSIFFSNEYFNFNNVLKFCKNNDVTTLVYSKKSSRLDIHHKLASVLKLNKSYFDCVDDKFLINQSDMCLLVMKEDSLQYKSFPFELKPNAIFRLEPQFYIMSEHLYEFYNGGFDYNGRSINDILAFSHDDMEKIHDWVQWAFPTYQRSQFNRFVPVLTPEVVLNIKKTNQFKELISKLTIKFEQFIISSKSLIETGQNHNSLRITRYLEFCNIFGLNCHSFYNHIMNWNVPDKTKSFWTNAHPNTYT